MLHWLSHNKTVESFAVISKTFASTPSKEKENSEVGIKLRNPVNSKMIQTEDDLYCIKAVVTLLHLLAGWSSQACGSSSSAWRLWAVVAVGTRSAASWAWGECLLVDRDTSDVMLWKCMFERLNATTSRAHIISLASDAFTALYLCFFTEWAMNHTTRMMRTQPSKAPITAPAITPSPASV